MYLLQLALVCREAFSRQPLIASGAYCSGCPPPLLCAADNASGLFSFREVFWVLMVPEDHQLQHCFSVPTTPPSDFQLWTQHSCTRISVCQTPCSFNCRECSYSTPSWLWCQKLHFSKTCCLSFIQISVQHHVWRVDATHNLVVDVMIFVFICGLSTCLPVLPLLWLWHGWREKWQGFFLWFLLVENTCKEGTRSAIHFCPTVNLFLNYWGKRFLFLLTVPVM
jgi:hypothetical protein